jgi:hypothetical protein
MRSSSEIFAPSLTLEVAGHRIRLNANWEGGPTDRSGVRAMPGVVPVDRLFSDER